MDSVLNFEAFKASSCLGKGETPSWYRQQSDNPPGIIQVFIVACVADTQFVKDDAWAGATQATEITANVFETVVLDNSNRKYTLA